MPLFVGNDRSYAQCAAPLRCEYIVLSLLREPRGSPYVNMFPHFKFNSFVM